MHIDPEELFTELRAELHEPDWVWRDSSFESFARHWRAMDRGGRVEFEEKFAPYLEQELSRRVLDAERICSIHHLSASRELSTASAFRWVRHVSFWYGYNTYTKKWIEQMKPKLERCVHADTSALTLYRLGHRGAVAFMDMLQDTVLGDARELAVILDAHYFRNKPGRAKEVLSHALGLWGEGLEHFALGFERDFRPRARGSVDTDEALDAVLELAPHLPSLKRLSLKHVSGTRAIVREVLTSFAHLEYLSVDMRLTTPLTYVSKAALREDVDALCELDAARALKGLCMGVPVEAQRERLRASETLAHIEQLQVLDPDFPVDPLAKRWGDPALNFEDALEQAAQGTGDAANPLADQQASLTELTISGDKRGAPEKMRALLFEDGVGSRVFPALMTASIDDVPSESMGLFLEHAASSLPRLGALSIRRSSVEPEHIERSAPMERVRRLKLHDVSASSTRLLLGSPEAFVFPHVEEVHLIFGEELGPGFAGVEQEPLRVDASEAREVFDVLHERLPSLRALELELRRDSPAFFKAFEDAGLLGELERFRCAYPKDAGVEFCLARALDDTLPLMMRRLFVSRALRNAGKYSLKLAVKFLGVTGHSRYSNYELTRAIDRALPAELRGYEAYVHECSWFEWLGLKAT